MNPEFLCLGFQKSGTTTLFELLEHHPDVLLARDVKEPMYYRIPAASSIGGSRYYQWRYFGHARPGEGRLLGEVNAGLTFTGCARRLKRDLPPETKLIFMMRNPVDRAYSAFKFFTALGFLPQRVVRDDLKNGHAQAFDHYCREILLRPENYPKIMEQRLKYLVFSQGNYDTCIGEYADTYPNCHYILFEEFVRDQHGVCRELYRFLGISDPEGIPYGIRANETSRRAAGPARAEARKIVKGFDYAFDEFLGMRYWARPVQQGFHRWNRKVYAACTRPDEDKSRMLPGTRVLLQDYYRREKDRLARRIGRDLNAIWYE